MKAKWVVMTCFAVVLSGAAAKAQQKGDWENTADLEFATGGDGATFTAYMPAGTLRKSPNLDWANPVLPKSLQEIVDTAFAELEKRAGKRPGWTCTDIVLIKPGFENNHPELAQKWLFEVDLRGPYKDPGVLQLPVTLDGHPGVIKEYHQGRKPTGN